MVCGYSLGSAAGQVLRLFFFLLICSPVPRWSRFVLSSAGPCSSGRAAVDPSLAPSFSLLIAGKQSLLSLLLKWGDRTW